MWINVKDKLPEVSKGVAQPEITSGPVLVFTKHNGCCIATYESWDDGETFKWYTDGERWNLNSVTHWQPLPEAPEV